MLVSSVFVLFEVDADDWVIFNFHQNEILLVDAEVYGLFIEMLGVFVELYYWEAVHLFYKLALLHDKIAIVDFYVICSLFYLGFELLWNYPVFASIIEILAGIAEIVQIFILELKNFDEVEMFATW